MQSGWVYRPGITDYEALLFYNGMYRHKDHFSYYPIAIAMREESGSKYRFLCIAVPKIDQCRPSHFADIEIYKPKAGMPYATCIYRQDFDKMFPDRMF